MLRAADTCVPGAEFPWLESRVPAGFWLQRENRIEYLVWLGRQLGFTKHEDWYRLRNRDLCKNRGGTLLNRVYGASVQRAVIDLYPEYNWRPWLFRKTPQGFWFERENRLEYMAWLEERLGIQNDDDWYKVEESDFSANSGAGILANHYNGSVLTAMCEYRPWVNWLPWKFKKVPRGFWADLPNRQLFYDWIAGQYRFRSLEDCDKLSKRKLCESYGSSLLTTVFRGSMSDLREEMKATRQRYGYFA